MRDRETDWSGARRPAPLPPRLRQAPTVPIPNVPPARWKAAFALSIARDRRGFRTAADQGSLGDRRHTNAGVARLECLSVVFAPTEVMSSQPSVIRPQENRESPRRTRPSRLSIRAPHVLRGLQVGGRDFEPSVLLVALLDELQVLHRLVDRLDRLGHVTTVVVGGLL
jgi:hypothetical protein